MGFLLDNRTLTFGQVAVSLILCVVMFVTWRTQKTYPGFGRWTVGKVPNAIGWLLIGLRGDIPDWASVLVGNALLLVSPILAYEGIRQFRGKSYRDALNYVVGLAVIGAFIYFTWLQPNVNARVVAISGFGAFIFFRCAFDLVYDAPRELRTSYWFTASMFALYDLVLLVRVVTSGSLPSLSNPFDADAWQNVLFMATNVVGIGWTFGFFMMTNNRLTHELGIAEAELREMAATDFLTGALNRRAFIEMGQHESARARRNAHPVTVLLIDIDHFKHLNDTCGHLAGDEMLQMTVAIFKANLRAIDLLARWGGEEFAILLPDTDQAGGLFVAEKLRRAVETLSISGNAESAHITISVGGALWQSEEDNLDNVLRRADIAMYRAKQRGRNCVVFFENP